MRSGRVVVHTVLQAWSRNIPRVKMGLTMISETLRFLAVSIVFCVALFGFAVLLTGCSEMKYAECIARDATSNPCN